MNSKQISARKPFSAILAIVSALFLITSVSCAKDPAPQPEPQPEPEPERELSVSTLDVSDIAAHGANFAGQAVMSGFDEEAMEFLQAGFLYSNSSTFPESSTVNVAADSIDCSTLVFSASSKVLDASTQYFVKAYVTIGVYSAEGAVRQFTTTSDTKPQPGETAEWAENPSNPEKSDDYCYTYHMTDQNDAKGKKARNYSVCYSKEKWCAMWVAAPYHDFYTGSSGRSNSYKSDPNFDFEQAGKWSGYTRGHLLGSSERTRSKSMNRQVFYYSNIAPQLQTYFNTGGGAWNDCEAWIEEQWSGKSDTTYVVTGCWWDPAATPKKVKSGDGASVYTEIPTHYYKVILRTKNHANKYVCDCSASELQCIAILMPHKTYGKAHPVPPSQYESSGWLMSVADLEKKTGFEYFVNVPNAPKSAYNKSDWGL